MNLGFEGGVWGYGIGELVVDIYITLHLRCTHIYSGGVGRVGEVGQMDNCIYWTSPKCPQ